MAAPNASLVKRRTYVCLAKKDLDFSEIDLKLTGHLASSTGLDILGNFDFFFDVALAFPIT